MFLKVRATLTIFLLFKRDCILAVAKKAVAAVSKVSATETASAAVVVAATSMLMIVVVAAVGSSCTAAVFACTARSLIDASGTASGKTCSARPVATIAIAAAGTGFVAA